MESFMDEQDQTFTSTTVMLPYRKHISLLDWTTYFTVVMIAWGSFSLLPFGRLVRMSLCLPSVLYILLLCNT